MTKKRFHYILPMIAACIVAAMFLFPLLYMFFTSFKNMGESYGSSALLPKNWTNENYITLFLRSAETPILRWLANTSVISIVGTALVITVDVFAAYALARLKLPANQVIVAILIWALSIPSIATIFPSFFIMKSLGFINTFIPLILPYTANVLGVYLLYSFLREFPEDLEESALIDGASNLRILWSIVFPSIKPSVITLAFLTFLSIYNDYLWPNLIVTNNNMKTMTLGIATLVLGSNFANPGMMMTATLISTLPPLLLLLFLNRYIVQGITYSGMK